MSRLRTEEVRVKEAIGRALVNTDYTSYYDWNENGLDASQGFVVITSYNLNSNTTQSESKSDFSTIISLYREYEKVGDSTTAQYEAKEKLRQDLESLIETTFGDLDFKTQEVVVYHSNNGKAPCYAFDLEVN